jgi:hypothetical protein
MEEQLIIIMLDAKSAFDVIVHNNMMMRLYHLGIQDKHWSLIQNLHSNATTDLFSFILHLYYYIFLWLQFIMFI